MSIAIWEIYWTVHKHAEEKRINEIINNSVDDGWLISGNNQTYGWTRYYRLHSAKFSI